MALFQVATIAHRHPVGSSAAPSRGFQRASAALDAI